eukprot:COSAG02_NODE_15414_length_1173_cov_1.423650_1_plen_148_part_00
MGTCSNGVQLRLGSLWWLLGMEDLRSPGFERSPSSIAASAEAAAAAAATAKDVRGERPPRRRRLSFSRILARIEQVKAEEAQEAQEAETGRHPSAVPSDPARPALCSPAPVAKKISRRWESRPATTGTHRIVTATTFLRLTRDTSYA